MYVGTNPSFVQLDPSMIVNGIQIGDRVCDVLNEPSFPVGVVLYFLSEVEPGGGIGEDVQQTYIVVLFDGSDAVEKYPFTEFGKRLIFVSFKSSCFHALMLSTTTFYFICLTFSMFSCAQYWCINDHFLSDLGDEVSGGPSKGADGTSVSEKKEKRENAPKKLLIGKHFRPLQLRTLSHQ